MTFYSGVTDCSGRVDLRRPRSVRQLHNTQIKSPAISPGRSRDDGTG
jgi:hypothetical protein